MSAGIGITVRQLPSGQHMIIGVSRFDILSPGDVYALTSKLLCVLQMVPGSAAANSPIEAGELVLSVDGIDCSAVSTDELSEHVLGPDGGLPLLYLIFFSNSDR